MTVSVYISRTSDGNEKGFEFPYERNAALQIAKAMWRRYGTSNSHFALVANMDAPPVDMAILSNGGLGVIELKDYNAPITGRDDSKWAVVGPPRQQLNSGTHLNAFQQVRSYRRRLFGKLRSFAREHQHDLPVWLARETFYIQAALVFTGTRFDTSMLTISPEVSKPWFAMRWLDETPDWAYSLAFGQSRRLSAHQVDFLATKLFETGPWNEISSLLDSRTPYGYLWVEIDGKPVWPIALDQDEMIIGRLPENAVSLDSRHYPLVSREHAKIRRVASGTTLTDIGSKHGTWLNSTKLLPSDERLLETGDRIILGKCDEQAHARKGACTLIYRSSGRYVGVTASKELS